MDKVRYGIIGIGKQGSNYAKRLFKGMDKNGVLAAVCDIKEDRRQWATDNLAGFKVFEDYKEMLASDAIDAVIIDTPHYAHPGIAIEALDAGKHVLCDKPAGVFTKAVREAAEHGKTKPELKFGILYNQRTNKVYVKAKEIIDSGRLGSLKRIVWIITNWYRPQAYYDQGGWRGTWAGEGGGVLINQDPHQLDLFTWLAGKPITKVWSVTKTVGRKINVENDVTAVCEFEGGAEGVLITSTHDAPGTNRLEITGDGGKMIIEGGSDVTMKLTFVENLVPEPQFSAENKVFMGKIPTKTYRYKLNLIDMIKGAIEQQHINVIRNFSRVVLGKEDKLIAPYADGLNGLTFSNAIHLSGWTGKQVVYPIDEEAYIAELNKRIAEEKSGGEKQV